MPSSLCSCWLPASESRAVRLPPASTICPPYGHEAQLPLQLTGVRDGAIIKRLPGAAEATLPLQSSGGAGDRWWFLNGEPLTERGRNVTLHMTEKGDYQMLVMDDVGQIATVKFVMQESVLSLIVAKTHFILKKCYRHQ